MVDAHWLRTWCPPRLRDAYGITDRLTARDEAYRRRSQERYMRRPDRLDLTPCLFRGEIGVFCNVTFVGQRSEPLLFSQVHDSERWV